MFENSKVQENGKLLTVYHGTNGRFKKFNKSKIGSHTDNGVYGRGFYFTDDKNQTYKYGKNQFACHLNIENPLVLGRGGEYDSFTDYSNKRKGIPEIRNREDYEKYGHLMATQEEGMNFLKQDGYDGIIIHPYNGAETEYVVFEPEQIEIIGQIKENLINLDFKPNITIADNMDSLVHFLKTKKGEYRITIDKKRGITIICPSKECIHVDSMVYAVDEGWYADYIKGNAWEDIDEYFGKGIAEGYIELLIFSDKNNYEDYDSVYWVNEYPFGFIFTKGENNMPKELKDLIGEPIKKDNVCESFGLKTGMAHYDKVLTDRDYSKDKHTFYEKIKMSPDAYIDACASGFRLNMYSTNYRKLYDGRVQDREVIEELKKVIQNGEMDVPVLSYYYYKQNDCNFEQEGIHRAIAAKELGYKEIPVLVFVAPATHHDDSVTDEFLLKELAGYIRKYNGKKFYETVTELSNFEKWFAGSKVVENGKPKVVYHGSESNFNKFNKSLLGSATKRNLTDWHGEEMDCPSAYLGFFFTDDEDFAREYGEYLYECYLKIENPLVVDMSEYMANDEVITQFIEQAIKEKRDGVIFKNIRELGRPVSTEYVVFEPTQIKIENTFEKLNEVLERYL